MSATTDDRLHGNKRGAGSLQDCGADRALLLLSNRVEILLDEEQAHLARGEFDALELVIERKSQLALDLARWGQQFGLAASESSRQGLAVLRSKLDQNATVLREHISAVSEIARIIGDTLQSETSDGTYSSNAAQRGFGR